MLLSVMCLSFSFCSEDSTTSNESMPEIQVEEEPIQNEVLDLTGLPASILDFSKWNISIPTNRGDGIATTKTVEELLNGYENSNFFYTSEDGGVTFKCFVSGPKTSVNTSYTRSELREMLRGSNTGISTQGVNKNNWVFGSAPQSDINASAGFDGLLEATLAVNHVTTTGSNSHIGRVIIGQIHANDNEPCRLYYRKLPNNTKGSIYFAHEPADGFGNEQWVSIIGSRSNTQSDPEDGIALDEKFSYTIETIGNELTVTIIREEKEDVSQSIDMTNSGYSSGGKYQYFKAGVYTQNNTGMANDYDKATFYNLTHSHSN